MIAKTLIIPLLCLSANLLSKKNLNPRETKWKLNSWFGRTLTLALGGVGSIVFAGGSDGLEIGRSGGRLFKPIIRNNAKTELQRIYRLNRDRLYRREHRPALLIVYDKSPNDKKWRNDPDNERPDELDAIPKLPKNSGFISVYHNSNLSGDNPQRTWQFFLNPYGNRLN